MKHIFIATSVENEDMDLHSRIVDHGATMVNFGTNDPPIVGWDALKKAMLDQNSALSQTTITVGDVSIVVPLPGKVAWASSRWNFKAMVGEKPLELPVRCTWILERRGDSWFIVHFHKSVATSLVTTAHCPTSST